MIHRKIIFNHNIKTNCFQPMLRLKLQSSYFLVFKSTDWKNAIRLQETVFGRVKPFSYLLNKKSEERLKCHQVLLI